jgi:hypothetical protein
VVVTNYSAVGFGHPVGPDKLLWGEKVDGALWNIKTVYFNDDRGAVIGSQCPTDEAVSHNGELGSNATYASIRRRRSEPIWEVERIVADGNRATTVEDDGGVVGGEWGDRECLIGDYVGRMNYRHAEGRRQSRIVEKTKDVEREDLWRFVLNNDLISLSIDNRLY